MQNSVINKSAPLKIKISWEPTFDLHHSTVKYLRKKMELSNRRCEQWLLQSLCQSHTLPSGFNNKKCPATFPDHWHSGRLLLSPDLSRLGFRMWAISLILWVDVCCQAGVTWQTDAWVFYTPPQNSVKVKGWLMRCHTVVETSVVSQFHKIYTRPLTLDERSRRRGRMVELGGKGQK